MHARTVALLALDAVAAIEANCHLRRLRASVFATSLALRRGPCVAMSRSKRSIGRSPHWHETGNRIRRRCSARGARPSRQQRLNPDFAPVIGLGERPFDPFRGRHEAELQMRRGQVDRIDDRIDDRWLWPAASPRPRRPRDVRCGRFRAIATTALRPRARSAAADGSRRVWDGCAERSRDRGVIKPPTICSAGAPSSSNSAYRFPNWMWALPITEREVSRKPIPRVARASLRDVGRKSVVRDRWSIDAVPF